MLGLWTTVLAAMFVYVNVHGAVLGLVHVSRSPGGAVPHDLAVDVGDEPTDPLGEQDGPDEESPPPPPSGLDEDDVKHCASVEWLVPAGPDARVAALARDELAHHHEHLPTLERPPRA